MCVGGVCVCVGEWCVWVGWVWVWGSGVCGWGGCVCGGVVCVVCVRVPEGDFEGHRFQSSQLTVRFEVHHLVELNFTITI